MKTAGMDHRTRVGNERRERMRARLLESALTVYARNGLGTSVIQQVIVEAGVAQGTFYNHFRTNQELLVAVSEELHNDMMRLIEGNVRIFDDPAARIAHGVRLYLHAARAFPLFARFVCSAGLHAAGPGNLIYEYLPAHIEAGVAVGRFKPVATAIALDLVAGSALAGVFRIVKGEAPPDYAEALVVPLLCALGVGEADARALAAVALEPIRVAPGSLLDRTYHATPAAA